MPLVLENMIVKNAPVVIFAFNRAEPLKTVLARLIKADGIFERDVIVYVDGARNESDATKIADVVNVAESTKNMALPRMEIRRREKNYGCQKNISSAISEVLNEYGKIIVIEDDVLVSKFFLRYMDDALDLYEHDARVWGINGHQCPYMRIPRTYHADVYLSPRNLCTGWGTWKDRWDKVDINISDWPDFISDSKNVERLNAAGCDIRRMLDSHYEGKLNSWALPCTYCMVKNSLFMIEPRYSLTKNFGFGIESVHNPSVEMAWLHQKYYNFLPHLEADI